MSTMGLFTDVLHLGLGSVLERVPQVRHLDSRTELSSYQCPRDGSSLLALKALLSLVRHKVIQLMGDNSTVVTDIENKGSTRSFRLTRLTIRLLRFCDQHSIILLPVLFARSTECDGGRSVVSRRHFNDRVVNQPEASPASFS